ncbi:MAG: DUF2304 domain-containing protein [Bacteroidetes bacterium]|nr:DUF2304 domain-containing protein [Bacteroidota bacterium]MBU1719675.1 DUF2304 domain-containing protein [Bacteroidota bacterium]
MIEFSFRIQLLSIIVSLLFLLFIGRLIVKGKLREEYIIFWVICTLILVVFSFWRDGLDVVAHLLGVYAPPNIVFLGAIFALFVYILYLSIILSGLQNNNRKLTQEMALLREMLEKLGKQEPKVEKKETDGHHEGS